jgi:acetyl-CoA synthetase
MMTPLPGAHQPKPGSATLPFFGVKPVVLSRTIWQGNRHEPPPKACCVLKDSWPGQMRTVWGDHERFEQTYFSNYKGYYFTG